ARHLPCIELLANYSSSRFIARIADENRLSRQVAHWGRLIDVIMLSICPTGVHKLIEELSSASTGRRNPEHPEIVVRQRQVPRIDGRKVRRKLVITLVPAQDLKGVHVDHVSDRLTFAHTGEKSGDFLVLIVDRPIKLKHVNH